MELNKIKIPYNKPSFVGNELNYIKLAVKSGKISGDGNFSKKCTNLLERKFNAYKILLTPSGTAALDLSALLLNLKDGDEVISPSFTFTSTVNSFVLLGAKPVFVDIRPDTLNIDETKIENAISEKTKAIYCVHYAGVACEMNKILEIADKYKIPVVEDAAQALNAKYKNQYLGTFGDFGVYSFHETKNINCGEGGAIVINNKHFAKRAEIIREKGTNRSQFFRGEIDKYTWCDIGSSYLLSEILAAYLYAQLEKMDEITFKRKIIYTYYKNVLSDLEKKGKVKLPLIPTHCTSNYHIFYILLNSNKQRNLIMDEMKKKGILAVFHYIPLHTSPMGKNFGYKKGQFPVTEEIAERLLRLPLYNNLRASQVNNICSLLRKQL